MTSYLTNLVNRLNQQSEVVQARPVSRFESPAPVNLSAWAAEAQPAISPTSDGEPSGETQPSELASLPPREVHWPESLLAQPATQEKPAGQRVVVRPETRRSPIEHPAESRPLEERQNADSPAAFRAGHPPPGQDRNEIVPGTMLKPGLIPSPVVFNPTGKGTIQAENQPPSGVQRLPSEGTLFSQPDLAHARLPMPLAMPMLKPAGAGSSEPVIHVTIGRVEVIAAAPTSPQKPQKERRQSQVMSLDEYLKSRDQEGKL